MMWPTLGGGIMLAVTPSPEEMEKVRSSTFCQTGNIEVATVVSGGGVAELL
jgi:hypothetical protein